MFSKSAKYEKHKGTLQKSNSFTISLLLNADYEKKNYFPMRFISKDFGLSLSSPPHNPTN